MKLPKESPIISIEDKHTYTLARTLALPHLNRYVEDSSHLHQNSPSTHQFRPSESLTIAKIKLKPAVYSYTDPSINCGLLSSFNLI